jgi:hypothetical protein
MALDAFRESRLRAIVLLTVLMAFASSTEALAAGSLPGTFKTKITGTLGFNGTWTVVFGSFSKSSSPTRHGSYSFTYHHQVRERGKYSVKRKKVTFTSPTAPNPCGPTPEIYAWKLRGRKLSFVVISSPRCLFRSIVLNNAFTRVS